MVVIMQNGWTAKWASKFIILATSIMPFGIQRGELWFLFHSRPLVWRMILNNTCFEYLQAGFLDLLCFESASSDVGMWYLNYYAVIGFIMVFQWYLAFDGGVVWRFIVLLWVRCEEGQNGFDNIRGLMNTGLYLRLGWCKVDAGGIYWDVVNWLGARSGWEENMVWEGEIRILQMVLGVCVALRSVLLKVGGSRGGYMVLQSYVPLVC